MTTPDPSGPLPMSLVNSVLTPDGTWHPVAPGAVFIRDDPVFLDPVTQLPVVMGGRWVQATDSDTGKTYGFPYSPDRFCVEWEPPPPPDPPPGP